MAEQMEMRKETSEQPETPSKYTGLGAAIATEVVIGFWFSTGVILTVNVVNVLEHCAEALTRGK